MSTIFSQDFRLAEWRFFTIPRAYGTDRDASPDPDPLQNRTPRAAFEPLTNRWVYVFKRIGDTTTWNAEIWVDAAGGAHAVDMAGAGGQERDRRPDPAPTGLPALRLPHTINGRRAFYYLYASRIRLPIDAVEQLRTRARALLPETDLAAEGAFHVRPPEVTPYVCATDPITVGINHNRRYQSARNALLNWTTPTVEQSGADRRATADRQRKLTLAQYLSQIRDQDRSDDLGLVNEFRGGAQGEARMRRFVTDYDARRDALARQANQRCAEVVCWLKTQLWAVTETAYRVFEADDFAKYVQYFQEVASRTSEAEPGKAFAASVIQNGGWIDDYVLRQSPATDLQFQVGRKCFTAIVTLWQELAAAHIQLRGLQRTVEVMSVSLRHIARTEVLAVVATRQTLRYIRETRVVTTTVTITTVRVTQGVTPAWWARFSQDGHAFADFARTLSLGVEVVNLAFSLSAVYSADGALATVQAAIGVIGSLADTVSAFGVILGVADVTLKRIGIFSAVLDTVGACFDARAMASRNDYSAMVGYGLVGIGSAVTALGCYVALAGGATASTGVGLAPGALLAIAGTVVVAVGWLIAVFTRDSDIEVFVAHCEWGRAYGDGDDEPRWAGAPLRSFRDNLDRQIAALLNLVCAFELDSADYTKVRIFHGTVMPRSTFRVNFSASYNLGITHQPQFRVNLSERTVEHIGGDRAETSAFYFGTREGRPFVEVEARHLRNDPRYERAVQHQSCTCEVWLELEGGGPARIPSSGRPVPYVIHRLGTGLNLSNVSSKDF